MKDIKDARDFTVTIGLSNGNEYVYVTHRESGRQWMSKNEVSHSSNLGYIAGNIIMGITKFGASAPHQDLFKQYGFTVENVVAKTKKLLGK